jgi:hypothetical protein
MLIIRGELCIAKKLTIEQADSMPLKDVAT